MAADRETVLAATPSPLRPPRRILPAGFAERPPVVGALVVLISLLALLIRLYQLTRPGGLLGVPQYDDGVYLGSAIRLLDGYVPYRDFAFVQPPGIVLLGAPLALLAKLTSSAAAMAGDRLLTALVGAITVALAGLLVRHRGALAVTLVCGILAVHPDSVKAASTLFLEPWLVFFLLLGALAVFQGDHLAPSARRALLAGLAIGFAGAVKAFAVFPALVLLGSLLVSDRRGRPGARQWQRSLSYLGGLIAGFGVPVLPFVVLAPHRFLYDVIGDQYQRTDLTHVALTSRLSFLFGLQYLNLSAAQVVLAVTLIIAALAACLAAGSLRARALPPALDWFAVISAAAVLISLLVPADFYWHYAAAFAPFLALSAGLSVGRVAAGIARPSPRRLWQGGLIAGAVLLATIGALVWMTADDVRQEQKMTALSVPASVDRVIPSGACVLADNPSLTIMADRFVSALRGCSPLVDSLGTDLSLGAAHNALNGAGRYPAVRRSWLTAFAHAQYVWLYCYPPSLRWCDLYTNRRIPWTPQIRGYFERHFHRSPAPRIFVRDSVAG